jgi:hypothetical protein
MVRAVEQIEREIAALDQTVAELAQVLHQTYQQYLTALGQATRRQLILAAYHICTHSYPEQFLSLSLNQRQDLQQSIQQLAKQGQAELLESLKPITAVDSPRRLASAASESLPELEPDAETTLIELEIMQEQIESQASSQSDAQLDDQLDEQFDEQFDDRLDTNSESSEVESSDLESGDAAQATFKAIAAAIAASDLNELTEADPDEVVSDRPLRPRDLARWQARLEKQIVGVLQNLSHSTNRLLQQIDILPKRLPEPVLEVASKADFASETTASPPNLLNLLVEANEEKSAMTQVVAVRLRLSEIEFNDNAASAQRSKVRQLMGQLTKLGREYQRKQRERAVVEAETAWRASWFEQEE